MSTKLASRLARSLGQLVLLAACVCGVVTEVSAAAFSVLTANSIPGSDCYSSNMQSSSPVSTATTCTFSDAIYAAAAGTFAAQASYDSLGASVDWTQVATGGPEFICCTEWAGARFEDGFVVTGGTGTGLLQMTIDVTGTQSAFGPVAVAYGELTTAVGAFLVDGATKFLVTGPGTYLFELAFVFGEVTELNFGLTAAVTNLFADAPSSAGGSANYTAAFSSLTILDANGVVVQAATVTGLDGHRYNVAAPVATPVPEPGVISLLALALAALTLFQTFAVRRRATSVALRR